MVVKESGVVLKWFESHDQRIKHDKYIHRYI